MSEEQLLSRLNQPIDKSMIKTREKSGVKLSYMAGFNSEKQANDIFKFKWSTETIYNQLIYKREYVKMRERLEIEMVEVAYEAKVRITVNINGVDVIREGTGAGNGICRVDNTFDAYELAMKEAETDARKRALKTLGDQFGLSLYDKDFDLQKANLDAKKYDLVFIENRDLIKETNDKEEVKKIYKEYQGSFADEIKALCVQKLIEIRNNK